MTKDKVIAIAAKGMTEAALQQAVIDLAHSLGYLVAHFRPSRTKDGSWRTAVAADGAGFVDLVLAKAGRRVLFIELKSERGNLSRAQVMWNSVLRRSNGVEYHVWRPSDWLSGEIEEVLRD